MKIEGGEAAIQHLTALIGGASVEPYPVSPTEIYGAVMREYIRREANRTLDVHATLVHCSAYYVHDGGHRHGCVQVKMEWDDKVYAYTMLTSRRDAFNPASVVDRLLHYRFWTFVQRMGVE